MTKSHKTYLRLVLTIQKKNETLARLILKNIETFGTHSGLFTDAKQPQPVICLNKPKFYVKIAIKLDLEITQFHHKTKYNHDSLC
jgi:hypothetical protein